ncbi:hypothetical protein SAMN05216353_1055 [Halobacillus alkaliphilus]|uniref:Uncharacterized protein n=1 Tax=Halobacillus alkaliphilus TaxID=396056 RepID=A0A1I2KKD6_9BACI|nr:hypothetical protein [Halobacillus alkaliphilus]SFF66798.1 hypothetical protein SAMN05216353_1055 [Halobacillus alkaliphilus]
MPFSTVTVKENKQESQLQVQRMAIFNQCKIIEAVNDQDQTYYLFFHKDQYLNYASAKKLTKRSYVNKAFQKGIVFTPPHPLIDFVLSSQPQFSKRSFNGLFKKLQKYYSLQETALIATYFESFINKEKLSNFIETLFYKERRDGKLLSCYRILYILKDFSPHHRLADAFSGDLDFNRYDERYKNNDETILSSDPIYMEKKLYSSKHHDQSFQKLSNMYDKQGRINDLLAISIQQAVHTQDPKDYAVLHTLIDSRFEDLDRLHLLEDLYKRGLSIETLQQDLLHAYIENEKFKDILKLIHQSGLTLTPHQSGQLVKMVKGNEDAAEELTPEELQMLLGHLLESGDPEAAEILTRAISSLLDEHEISYIKKWGEPLKHYPKAEPIIKKVDLMNELIEDPNQQLKLGELYHEFRQPEKAIECMSFDMELREEDHRPVQWLAKLYHEVGMKEEHHAYKQLYIDMVKRQA